MRLLAYQEQFPFSVSVQPVKVLLIQVQQRTEAWMGLVKLFKVLQGNKPCETIHLSVPQPLECLRAIQEEKLCAESGNLKPTFFNPSLCFTEQFISFAVRARFGKKYADDIFFFISIGFLL